METEFRILFYQMLRDLKMIVWIQSKKYWIINVRITKWTMSLCNLKKNDEKSGVNFKLLGLIYI